MKNTTFKRSALSALIILQSFNLQAADDVKSSDWTGNISGYIGSKSLKEEDWNTLDNQVSLGVIFDIKKEKWPVSLVFDAIGSTDVYEIGTQKDTGSTREFDLGIRKIFDSNDSAFKPYIGGGVAFISAEIKNEIDSNSYREKKDATGAWVGAGVYYAMTPKFNVGFDVRYSEAHVTLLDEEREIGGLNAGLTFGYHF